MSANKIDQLFQKTADFASEFCGTPLFLGMHLFWWILWFIFRPEHFPFNFLTMLLSLEAIVLAILILNSSNRQGEFDRAIIQRDVDLDAQTHATIKKIWEKMNE